MRAEDLVGIGQNIKPFGIRGDVRVRSLTDVPGRFERLGSVTLETPSGRLLQTSVTRVRADRESYVVGFQAFSSPEEASAFRGALIKVQSDRSNSLPEGQYLECDLLGMIVRTEEGRTLGVLEDVLHTAGNAVFLVRADHEEILIPATKQAVAEIDVPSRIMTVRLMKGLLESSTGRADAL
jgi:16S rRNA processing protein RimM